MAKCDSPLTVFPKEYAHPKHGQNPQQSYPVPCGKCPPCKKTRVAGWRFRMMQEEKIAYNCYFITLTYDTSTVPITENGFMTLHKDHLTLFFKQLRIKQSRQPKLPTDFPKIKYYACAEYGTLKSRPHYHAIIYNVWDPVDIGKSWVKGMVDIQTQPSAGSFAYTAGYIQKEKRIPMHKNDDRVREFSRISQKLGQNYCNDKKIVNWHLADVKNRCYLTENGKKIPMPRYYKNKIYSKQQLEQIGNIAQSYYQETDEYNDTKLENDLKQGRYHNYYYHKKIRE